MIEAIGTLGVLRGYAFGLAQPGAFRAVRLQRGRAVDVAAFDAWMAQLVDEPVAASEAAHASDPEAALIQRCAAWAIAVQRACRLPVSQRCSVSERAGAGKSAPRDFQVGLPCVASRAVEASLEWVIKCANFFESGLPVEASQVQAALEACTTVLRAVAGKSINNYYIASAAYEIGMPVDHTLPGLLTVGTGETKRWFFSSITDETPSIGVMVASDKRKTASLLRQAGLPGAQHALAGSAEQAIEIAARLGFPVVVKPADREQGEGVAADLRSNEAVAKAFAAARKCSENILVERHCEGFTHRLTVFKGRLIKVVKRIAGGVVGDGRASVAALVAQAQAVPELRRRSARAQRELLALDEEACELLAQYGRTPDFVPGEGEYVRLRRRDNRNAGGTNESVALEAVHPANRELAIRAAALLKLDFAGIDLIIQDVSRAWFETGALICEINAQPQMGTQDSPTLYQDLLAEALPGGGRIPVHAVLAQGRDTERERALIRARWPDQTEADASGLWIDGQRVAGPFADGFEAARAALAHSDVKSLRCVLTVEEVRRWGLPLDRIDRLSVLKKAAQPGKTAQETAVMQALVMVRQNVGKIETIEVK